MKIISINIARIRSYSLLALVVFLFSCNELDLQPLDAVIEDNFFKTEVDFKGATLASYSSIQSLYATTEENLYAANEWWKLTIMTEDDMSCEVDSDLYGYNKFRFLPEDNALSFIYTIIYQGVYRANKVLEKLDEENELTAEEKAQYEGEAKFLRAWFHFQSFKLWGGNAPLMEATLTDFSNLSAPNSTPEATIALILSDLQTAANNLPESWDDSNLGRATSWAAIAYMGKVNLYNGDPIAAMPFFKNVYEQGPYSLMPDYASVFDYDFENNQESIFEVQFTGNSDDNGWVLDDFHSENFKATQGYNRGSDQDIDGGAIYRPTAEYAMVSDAEDPRYAVNIYGEGDIYYDGYGDSFVIEDMSEFSDTGYLLKKYRGENIAKMGATNEVVDYNNERLFRYADLILLYAETLIDSDPGLATDLINEVRLRSYPDATPVAYGLSATELTDALRLERRLELAFEGQRYFDLVRWGIANETFDALDTGTNDNLWDSKTANGLFPIPQSEIERSQGVLNQLPGL
ncbi:RagB/SusD family nutrient uptake outer membrane protein [Maribacter sp. ANRC-HE7]|uniref:RagB/SusD family nutrient uptake outer membrane protein n=1 Tax=Maribacter aquimaris TaxID=2737171 RepID=A0ABR7V6M9_9FLAO|nr:RagB/SusD family nutrient uptake outer membrane protein [Maribacter aquimaris]MBD0779600.1 RagB/SusD family nutrient uptake outer membrane protein [Maribacter aquimaris]